MLWKTGTLCAGLVITTASFANAIEEKQKETCRVTTDIVQSSVTQRVQGEDVNAVKDVFMTGKTAVAEKYQPTVGPIVDWVFSLEPAVIQGSGAAKAVADTYHKSCLGFNQ